jgi:hypothetical protein
MQMHYYLINNYYYFEQQEKICYKKNSGSVKLKDNNHFIFHIDSYLILIIYSNDLSIVCDFDKCISMKVYFLNFEYKSNFI